MLYAHASTGFVEHMYVHCPVELQTQNIHIISSMDMESSDITLKSFQMT